MSEPDVSQLLTVAQAIEIIDRQPVTPRIIELPLNEADGLVLAGEIHADRDYPPFDRSLMDGFAVRCVDVGSVPADLRVIGEIAAGEEAQRGIGAGEAMAIMTGAPLPPGADVVVPIEDVQRHGSSIRVMRAGDVTKYISRKGSDAHAHQLILEKGAKLGPAQLAAAASVGAAKIKVFAAVRAGVLSTGDELVGIDQPPRGSQIRNSNNIMLISLLKRLGCQVRDLGIAPDRPDAIRAAIEDGMRDDVLLVSGGMSMGQYDFVPKVLRELGLEFRITKLKIKPGKPYVFAVKAVSGKCVFGLPGNPLSGFVCTLRLASRLIARLAGGSPEPRWAEGKLVEPLEKNGPREFYQPAVLDENGVRPLIWKGSADLYTLARANCLLVRGENEPAMSTGQVVKVLQIP
jgi:molybdopterin molybdotransferase